MAKIIIGTDMDNSGFERKYKKLKRKVENDKVELKGTTSNELENSLKSLNKQLDLLNQKTETLEKNKAKLEASLKTSYKKEVEELKAQYKYVSTPFENLPAGQTAESAKGSSYINNIYQEKLDAINNKYKTQINSLNIIEEELKTNANKQKEIELSVKETTEALEKTKYIDSIKESINGINKGLTKTVKKIGYWALAVFGVRSAYMFVRNAINMITQEDEQLKYDIQAIKTALAYSIEPIIRRIIELAKTLIGYLAYIIHAWTGRDIFASADKHLASANASAKELEKTTASFDKFNKLGSSKSGGGSGATTKLNMPTDQEMEGTWIGWIAKNGKKVKSILLGIATAIVAIKLGLAPVPAIILGIATAIVAYLISKYDEIIEGFNKFLDWLKGPFKDKVKKDWGLIGAVFVDLIAGAVAGIKALFEGIIGGIKKIATGILDIFKGDFKTGLKNIFSGLADIILAPFKAIYNAVDTVITQIFEALGLISKLNSYMGGGTGSFGGGGSGGARAKGGIYYPNMPKLALGGIINMPGRGVAYHGATIGERGAEAVVPLTDTAQMELLGATIGKYVSVNADITLEIESRILAKVMKEINNNNSFMRNGG